MTEREKEVGSNEKLGQDDPPTGEDDPRTVVLQAMYTDPKTSVGWIPSESWEDYMAEKTGLNKMSIRNARVQLEQVGLVQESQWISPEYILTREGYKIAHEQEMMRRQLENDRKQTNRMEDVNSQYNNLTFLLVVIGALELLAAVIQSSFDWATNTAFYIIILLIVSVAYLFIVHGPKNNRLSNS